LHTSYRYFPQDFDIHAFDAFCVLVCDDKYNAELGVANNDPDVTHAPNSLQFVDMESNGSAQQNGQSQSEVCRQSALYFVIQKISDES